MEQTKKAKFINRFNQIANEGVEYILIDIKSEEYAKVETIRIPKTDFATKLEEIKLLYDDYLYTKTLDEPVIKILSVYSK